MSHTTNETGQTRRDDSPPAASLTTRPAHVRPALAVPRLALSPDEASQALGCSRDYFDEHILGELRVVRRGRRIFVGVRELERWLAESAARSFQL